MSFNNHKCMKYKNSKNQIQADREWTLFDIIIHVQYELQTHAIIS